jgi:Ni,Fe-hydrogenase III large subunit/Ni,Fe-hydrogenase III component G
MNTLNTDSENRDITRMCQFLFDTETAKEVYLPVSKDELFTLVHRLNRKEIRLISLFCAENFNGVSGFTLFYVMEKVGCPNIVVVQHQLESPEITSVARQFPSANWYEREIQDGFGIRFLNGFDTRRLFLHEAYPDGFHPLLKSFRNKSPVPARDSRRLPGESYKFKRFDGEGVYEIPVGPVHAGIIEPGHFRFSAIGETVMGLEVRMFYKHRGIEKLAEGKSPDKCVTIAETISGDESAANATAFCMAVEKISGLRVPLRAWQLRTVMLELERIYSHLGDLAGMMVDVAYPVGAGDFFILREEILRLNNEISGSRFLKGLITLGGLKKDIPEAKLTALGEYFSGFSDKFRKAVAFIHRSPSVIDRLETTGIISEKIVNPLNITGPAARASGAYVDTRVDHPYGLYQSLDINIRTADRGDVLSRFNVKAEEVLDSAAMVKRVLSGIEDGPICTQAVIKDGCVLVLVEAARGQNMHWVYIKEGVIDRYKVRTASFCNWQAIEHAVIGNIVPDFPLINKSLNLSYAGTDL